MTKHFDLTLPTSTRQSLASPLSRRTFVGVASGAAATIGATGSSQRVQARQATPIAGGSLVMADTIDATSVDPQVSNEIPFFYAYVEGLTSLSDAGEVGPFLATSWDVDADVRIYTFKLREGVQFHNGRVLTADDVKWSLNRLKDPSVAAPRGNDLRDVTIDVVDPLTVRLTAVQPNAAIPALLASCFILAPESAGADGSVGTAIGTGPFAFVSWTPGQEIRLRRHMAYWRAGQPYLDEVVYQVIPDPVARLNAIRSESIDIAASISPTDLPLIQADEGITTYLTTANVGNHLTFNTRNPQPPLDDVRVRRAIAHALDKSELVIATVGEGGPGQVNNQLWTDGQFWRLPVEDQFATPNRDQSRQLLAEAGVTDGFKTTLVTRPEQQPGAEVIQAQLREIGVDVEIVTTPDFPSYKQLIEQFEYGMLHDASFPRDDPAYTFTFFESTNPTNIYYGGFGDPAVDTTLDGASASPDTEVRRAAYATALDTITHDDLGTVFVLSRQNVWVGRSDVQGFTPGRGPVNRVDGGLGVTWLDR